MSSITLIFWHFPTFPNSFRQFPTQQFHSAISTSPDTLGDVRGYWRQFRISNASYIAPPYSQRQILEIFEPIARITDTYRPSVPEIGQFDFHLRTFQTEHPATISTVVLPVDSSERGLTCRFLTFVHHFVGDAGQLHLLLKLWCNFLYKNGFKMALVQILSEIFPINSRFGHGNFPYHKTRKQEKAIFNSPVCIVDVQPTRFFLLAMVFFGSGSNVA